MNRLAVGPPLSLRGVVHVDLIGPGSREIEWRPHEECEALLRAGRSNLLIKFEGLSGKMLPDVEQYQVIHIALPQEACCLQTVGGMYLDAVTS